MINKIKPFIGKCGHRWMFLYPRDKTICIVCGEELGDVKRHSKCKGKK